MLANDHAGGKQADALRIVFGSVHVTHLTSPHLTLSQLTSCNLNSARWDSLQPRRTGSLHSLRVTWQQVTRKSRIGQSDSWSHVILVCIAGTASSVLDAGCCCRSRTWRGLCGVLDCWSRPRCRLRAADSSGPKESCF